MKILAVNATYRKNGTTTRLVRRALEGAASAGAETEMILLADRDVRLCRNCLQCYRDLESELAPCPIDDDVGAILRAILDADGVVFASPIHNGFVSASMVALFERMVWRVCRPTGKILGLKGVPEPRRKERVRAIASIVSAGGMPDRLRSMCDGTPFLKENAPHFLNGFWVGDMYAAAHLRRRPRTDEDWRGLYFLRELSTSQFARAHDLGVRMAKALDRGGRRPTRAVGPVTAAILRPIAGFMGRYRTVEKAVRGDESGDPPPASDAK